MGKKLQGKGLPNVRRLRQRDLEGNVRMDKVRVVQQIQRPLLNGLAEVQEAVEKDKGHVLPAHGAARRARLVEGLDQLLLFPAVAR